MKSVGFILMIMLSSFAAFAQTDTANVNAVKPEYDFVYQELFNFLPNSTFGPLKLESTVPALNQNFSLTEGLVKDYQINTTDYNLPIASTYFRINPFVNSLAITNQAHYKLSNKFTLEGSSFVGNSIFNPLPANPSVQDMNIHGASLLLQYKLSKHVKVSGSVTISNQDQPFIP
ncbi:MAG TPA: hypothetical protein VKA27_11655 [Sunxiuqinia sp.]|nr:hypothetical protein [Sunxiuqinia sp.]